MTRPDTYAPLKLPVFNSFEESLCNQLASLKSSKNRSAGVVDAKRGPQSAAAAELEACGAEIAIAKLFNVYPDLSIHPRRGGADLIIPVLGAVDVKQTVHKHGKLMVVAAKAYAEIDTYILVVGGFNDYLYAGCISRQRMLRDFPPQDLGYGPTHVIPQKELKIITPSSSGSFSIGSAVKSAA